MNPSITVILPVYNTADFIGECIDSILNQTYSNFHCLVIDDASTDITLDIIKSYTDPRIQLIEKQKNTGYTDSLNLGLSLAKSAYIARMDADDVCELERFKKQITFLEANPEVMLCGTNYHIYNTDRLVLMPETFEAIKTTLLQGTAFGHPTVMFRQSVMEDNGLIYDSSKEPAEDYDLWVRLLKFGKMYNLQEPLLKYRLHDNQVSETQRQKQLKSKLATRVAIFDCLDLSLSSIEKELLKVIIGTKSITFSDLRGFTTLSLKLIKGNHKGFFVMIDFKKYLKDLERDALHRYFIQRNTFFPGLILHYLQLFNKLNVKLTLAQTFKLLVKSVFYRNNLKRGV